MIDLKTSVALAPLTTFGIGGQAEYYVEVDSLGDVSDALHWAADKKLHVQVLGGGSNVLIEDSGVKGLVVKNNLSGVSFQERGDDVLVTAASGELFDAVISKAVEKGYWGLENLSAIPGSVGATPIQNVGAYGVEVADLIESVKAINLNSREDREFKNPDCQFGYRDSFFKSEAGKNFFVTEVTYRLSRHAAPKLEYRDLSSYFNGVANPSLSDIRQAVIEIRSRKFPDWKELGTAGSFFKNPVVSLEKASELQSKFPDMPVFLVNETDAKLSLSWVLDKLLNLKGYRVGNAGTYKDHVLVMVNYGGAKAGDVATVAKEIESQVYDLLGVKIEWEVTRIG